MSSAVLFERSQSSAGIGQQGYGFQSSGAPAGSPAAANWCVLPRCEIKFEKCTGGFKIQCVCDDNVACGTLQNLCRMMSEGLCSCCCTYNGITVCQCNFSFCNCKCEYTKNGVCITCSSGDKKCCEMLQACCESLSCCCDNGCCCYISFNNNPICCGTC
jgi:hypothetical protein